MTLTLIARLQINAYESFELVEYCGFINNLKLHKNISLLSKEKKNNLSVKSNTLPVNTEMMIAIIRI